MNCFKNGPKNENFGRFYSLGRIRVSFLGQRGSVGQKVYIARFLDRVGHLGGVGKPKAAKPSGRSPRGFAAEGLPKDNPEGALTLTRSTVSAPEALS